jgi:hypothetical protein
VRERHAAKRARPVFAVGMRVLLGGREYELLAPRKSWSGRAAGWLVVDVSNSGRYRMSAQQAARATLAPEKFPGMSDDELLAALADEKPPVMNDDDLIRYHMAT